MTHTSNHACHPSAPPAATASRTIATFAAHCRADGFDVVHPFSVADYNANAPSDARVFDLGRPNPLGLIVGNTRFLWPVFEEALREAPERAEAPNPIDEYSEQKIAGAASRTLPSPYVVSWVHVTHPAPIAVQRIAHHAGLAWLSPSHLSIHPVYGPWLAFRAVVVVDLEGPEAPRLPPDPCSECTKPCIAALEAAARESRDASVSSLGWAWPLWAEVRNVCPQGAAHRYGEDQIRYHYAKDRAVLRRSTKA
jgi:methylmalonic aciduria homocystinuria type C protein